MLPNLDHLASLRDDDLRFEAERSRIISEYIKSLPEEHQRQAYAYQLRIDAARLTMSSERFLQWMVNEASEMADNLSDQFLAIAHKAQDIEKSIEATGRQ